MIDVKELRIGNIANCYSSERKGNMPFYVEQIFVDEVYLQNEDEGFQIMADRLDGIPLTEELLLKCGFKKTGDFAFEYKDDTDLIFDAPNDWNNTDDYPIGISSIDPGFPAMYIPHGEVIIRCLYLHDLQNKFFAITGKELGVEL